MCYRDRVFEYKKMYLQDFIKIPDSRQEAKCVINGKIAGLRQKLKHETDQGKRKALISVIAAWEKLKMWLVMEYINKYEIRKRHRKEIASIKKAAKKKKAKKSMPKLKLKKMSRSTKRKINDKLPFFLRANI